MISRKAQQTIRALLRNQYNNNFQLLKVETLTTILTLKHTQVLIIGSRLLQQWLALKTSKQQWSLQRQLDSKTFQILIISDPRPNYSFQIITRILRDRINRITIMLSRHKRFQSHIIASTKAIRKIWNRLLLNPKSRIDQAQQKVQAQLGLMMLQEKAHLAGRGSNLPRESKSMLKKCSMEWMSILQICKLSRYLNHNTKLLGRLLLRTKEMVGSNSSLNLGVSTYSSHHRNIFTHQQWSIWSPNSRIMKQDKLITQLTRRNSKVLSSVPSKANSIRGLTQLLFWRIQALKF